MIADRHETQEHQTATNNESDACGGTATCQNLGGLSTTTWHALDAFLSPVWNNRMVQILVKDAGYSVRVQRHHQPRCGLETGAR